MVDMLEIIARRPKFEEIRNYKSIEILDSSVEVCPNDGARLVYFGMGKHSGSLGFREEYFCERCGYRALVKPSEEAMIKYEEENSHMKFKSADV